MTPVDSLEPTVVGAGWQHRRVVGAWIVVAVVLAGCYLVLRPTRFQGRASIVVEQGVAPGVNPTVTPDRFVADQVALLRSPVVAARAASILAKGDSNVAAQPRPSLGRVSVSSNSNNSEIKISVEGATASAADAGVRALLDAYSQVKNENRQAATSPALQQLDSAIAGVDAQLAKINPTNAPVPDPRVAPQVTQLVNERNALQQQRDQTNITNSLSADRFIVSSQPASSRQSIRGTSLKLGILALALGFLIGVGHAYLLGLQRKRFSTKLQPHALLQAPLLIDVPDFELGGRGSPLVVRESPSSQGAEAFAFAAQMQFDDGGRDHGRGVVVAVTGAERGVGTTTVVANLGLALAQSGLHVLLVDGAVSGRSRQSYREPAEPSLTELFLGPGGASLGLLDVTEGRVGLEDAAATLGERTLMLLAGGSGYSGASGLSSPGGYTGDRRSGAETGGAHDPDGSAGVTQGSNGSRADRSSVPAARRAVLPADAQPSLVSAGLSPFALEQLLVEARAHFDCVVIDTPPVLSIGARALLLQGADRVVMVVAHGEQIGPVSDAGERIHALGPDVAGYVYNRTPRPKPSRH